MLDRAATRALRDPGRYMMIITPDIGAARLAIGMLGHPAHVLEALNAMGWGMVWTDRNKSHHGDSGRTNMNRCDLHVIVCDYCRQDWLDELLADLKDQPVNLHFPDCVEANVGASRAAGFAMGTAEFVSFADPDDRILPGAVDACIAALDADPELGVAFTGEQIVTALLDPAKHPATQPYDRRSHRYSPAHVHGLIVMRRALVEPWLDQLAAYRVVPEWFLTLAISQSSNLARVPMIGRLWRFHDKQASRRWLEHLLVSERQAIEERFGAGNICNGRGEA